MEKINQEDSRLEKEKDLLNFLPAEKEDYFKDLHKKHFLAETAVGSLFTDVKNLQELLDLTIEQRKEGLDGDDKISLVAMGVAKNALLPQCRYLLVKTSGDVGIINAKELPQDQTVYVKRLKQGTPCTLFVENEIMPKTDIATIIIGPNEEDSASTEEMIWTVHPGLPIRPAKTDIWQEGSELTVMEVMEEFKKLKLGDAILNVKLKK